MSVERFLTQHQEIVDIAGQMAKVFRAGTLSGSEHQMASLLSQLAGKLVLHLTLEDEVLYPRLLKHQDPKVQQKAQAYMDEMGGLKTAFGAYQSRWNESSIKADNEGFINESRKIFQALKERIKRENNDLYPLVD